MDMPEPSTPATEHPAPPGVPYRRRLNSTMVAGGAAVAMMLAGLGIAGAQVGETSPSEPPAAEGGRPAGEGDRPEDCHRKEGHDGARRHGRRHKIGVGLEVAAKAIGIPRQDLVSALRSGQSIADVARSKSVDPASVVEAMMTEARTRLSAKVEAGDITQAQAGERLAKLKERFEKFVNHQRGAGG